MLKKHNWWAKLPTNKIKSYKSKSRSDVKGLDLDLGRLVITPFRSTFIIDREKFDSINNNEQRDIVNKLTNQGVCIYISGTNDQEGQDLTNKHLESK